MHKTWEIILKGAQQKEAGFQGEMDMWWKQRSHLGVYHAVVQVM